jgi:hypothetical protein
LSQKKYWPLMHIWERREFHDFRVK